MSTDRTTSQCVDLEHAIAPILARQCAKGVMFDREAAYRLYSDLLSAKVRLRTALQEVFPTRVVSLGLVCPKASNSKYGTRKGCEYTRIKFEEYNPSSRPQTVDRLKKQFDWNPMDFTEKGSPKLDEEIIEALPFPQVAPLKEYMIVDQRLKQLSTGKQSFMNCVKEDGRIHGSILQSGTVTGRMAHHSPNMNVPRVDKPWGKEFRALFTVPPGKVLIGCDADGLEARTLGGYLKRFDSGQFIKALLEGDKTKGTDIHSINARAYQVDHLKEGRDAAKTLFYACVPMDTLVLSKTGWKAYETLKVGELVLTYNQTKNIKEWKPVLEKVYYKDAPVVEMTYSYSFSFRSTPNHRWFVRQRRQDRPGRYGTINGHYMDPQVRTTEEINTESNIIVNAPLFENSPSNYTFNFKDDKYDRDWVQEVLNMNQTERRAFLNGFLLADGYKDPNGTWKWSQNKTTIAEGALVASYLESDNQIYITERKDSKNPMYVVNIGAKQHITGQKLKKIQHPNQPVWCIRTENESFVARQGNTITITGNTIYGAKNPKLGLILLSYGINFEEYVPDFHNQLSGILKWRDKKGLDFSDKTMECLVAGKYCRESYGEQMPALPELIKDVTKIWKENGFLKGLDGRKLFPRSEHAVFNTLNQSAGACIMKKALQIADSELQLELRSGQDYEFVLSIHDEYQLEVTNELKIIEYVTTVLPESIKKAGEFFNFPCPMSGSAKQGRNWSETH